ncbi:MAG: HNH endonuclease [Bacteroidota bacterium]
MPQTAIKSVRDIIFYQYAKIISSSAGFGKENYGMIMSNWKKFKSGEMHWSTSVREWLREHENHNKCIYCGAEGKLTTEHILPRSKGGEDISDNVVRVCKACNSSKGDKRLYEWKGLKNKDSHHRIAEGKYLKYLYSLHEKRGTLEANTVTELCKNCDMSKLCERDYSVEKLSVYCIEGCFNNIKKN